MSSAVDYASRRILHCAFGVILASSPFTDISSTCGHMDALNTLRLLCIPLHSTDQLLLIFRDFFFLLSRQDTFLKPQAWNLLASFINQCSLKPHLLTNFINCTPGMQTTRPLSFHWSNDLDENEPFHVENHFCRRVHILLCYLPQYLYIW